MKYADFMAFPFPPNELIKKRGNWQISPDIVIDFCHTTSVPPYMRKMDEIVKEHLWFMSLLAKQKEPAKLGYFFGLQNPPEDATTDDLLILKGLGIRLMTLAYECENEYGGGFATPNKSLTNKGQRLLESMARAGMVLDLSHAGHQTARNALDYCNDRGLKLKIVATHTACFDLYNHHRGLSDDTLAYIVNRGGLIGLASVSWMLHATDNSLKPFLAHLEYLDELVGENKICLGTDGVYHRIDLEVQKKEFEMIKAKFDPHGNFKARYPCEAVQLNRPDKLLIIENHLKMSLGWSKSKIEKVMGQNLINFFTRL